MPRQFRRFSALQSSIIEGIHRSNRLTVGLQRSKRASTSVSNSHRKRTIAKTVSPPPPTRPPRPRNPRIRTPPSFRGPLRHRSRRPHRRTVMGHVRPHRLKPLGRTRLRHALHTHPRPPYLRRRHRRPLRQAQTPRRCPRRPRHRVDHPGHPPRPRHHRTVAHARAGTRRRNRRLVRNAHLLGLPRRPHTRAFPLEGHRPRHDGPERRRDDRARHRRLDHRLRRGRLGIRDHLRRLPPRRRLHPQSAQRQVRRRRTRRQTLLLREVSNRASHTPARTPSFRGSSS